MAVSPPKRMIPSRILLSSEISSLSIGHAARLLDGDETALTDLKATIAQLHNKKRQLLINAGLSADFLEMNYNCPDCKDTGYINHEK